MQYRVILKCDNCKKDFPKAASRVRKSNYCSKECKYQAKWDTRPCAACGKPVTRLRCAMLKEVCCDSECSRMYLSKKMADRNAELNPTRMCQGTKEKLREAHLGKGEHLSYEKTFGRHTHRIVAEQKLGRPLRPGEVVHHLNENIRDNRPENLMIFASQAEHARWHAELNYLLYGTPICSLNLKATS